MRCADNLRMLLQCCRHYRFLFKHIKTGTSNNAIIKRMDKCRLIYNRASCHIDQNALSPKRSENICIGCISAR